MTYAFNHTLFAERLKAVRKERALKQVEAAEQLSITRVYYNRLEKALIAEPGLLVTYAVCMWMGEPVERFLAAQS